MEEIITKSQVINTIGTKLGEEFSSIGFKFIKSKNELIRKNKEGFDKIVLSSLDYYPINHQELSIGFFKRLNIVEDIVNQFNDERLVNPDFKKNSFTISTNYNFLSNNQDYVFDSEDYKKCLICNKIKDIKANGFILHTEKDIQKITSFLSNFIKNKVLFFFEENNDLEHINIGYKKQNLNPSTGYLPLFSIMHSLVLMKLTKDPSFDVLKKEYLKRLVMPFDDFETNKIEIEVVTKLIYHLENFK